MNPESALVLVSVLLGFACVGITLQTYRIKQLKNTLDQHELDSEHKAFHDSLNDYTVSQELARLSRTNRDLEQAKTLLGELHAAFRQTVQDVTKRLGGPYILQPMFEPARKAAVLLQIPLWDSVRSTREVASGERGKPPAKTVPIGEGMHVSEVGTWPEHPDVDAAIAKATADQAAAASAVDGFLTTEREPQKLTNDVWHDSYRVRATNEVIDGRYIRLFADWDGTNPNTPRYAEMTSKPHKPGEAIVTYLDSELEPIGEGKRGPFKTLEQNAYEQHGHLPECDYWKNDEDCNCEWKGLPQVAGSLEERRRTDGTRDRTVEAADRPATPATDDNNRTAGKVRGAAKKDSKGKRPAAKSADPVKEKP